MSKQNKYLSNKNQEYFNKKRYYETKIKEAVTDSDREQLYDEINEELPVSLKITKSGHVNTMNLFKILMVLLTYMSTNINYADARTTGNHRTRTYKSSRNAKLSKDYLKNKSFYDNEPACYAETIYGRTNICSLDNKKGIKKRIKVKSRNEKKKQARKTKARKTKARKTKARKTKQREAKQREAEKQKEAEKQREAEKRREAEKQREAEQREAEQREAEQREAEQREAEQREAEKQKQYEEEQIKQYNENLNNYMNDLKLMKKAFTSKMEEKYGTRKDFNRFKRNIMKKYHPDNFKKLSKEKQDRMTEISKEINSNYKRA